MNKVLVGLLKSHSDLTKHEDRDRFVDSINGWTNDAVLGDEVLTTMVHSQHHRIVFPPPRNNAKSISRWYRKTSESLDIGRLCNTSQVSKGSSQSVTIYRGQLLQVPVPVI